MSEVGDDGCVEAFVRDSKDPLDKLGMLRMAHGRILKERVDGAEPRVARAYAVVPGGLEMLKEGAHGGGVQIL